VPYLITTAGQSPLDRIHSDIFQILINQRYESIGYKCLTATDIWQLAVFAFVFAAVIIAAIGSSSAQKECNRTKKRRNEHVSSHPDEGETIDDGNYFSATTTTITRR